QASGATCAADKPAGRFLRAMSGSDQCQTIGFGLPVVPEGRNLSILPEVAVVATKPVVGALAVRYCLDSSYSGLLKSQVAVTIITAKVVADIIHCCGAFHTFRTAVNATTTSSPRNIRWNNACQRRPSLIRARAAQMSPQNWTEEITQSWLKSTPPNIRCLPWLRAIHKVANTAPP